MKVALQIPFESHTFILMFLNNYNAVYHLIWEVTSYKILKCMYYFALVFNLLWCCIEGVSVNTDFYPLI